MELILIIAVIGLIPAMIASSKGRSFFLWWVYGAALFIIALVHALLLKSPAQQRQEAAASVGGSVAEEIARFAKLKEDGVLSEAEFTAKKRELLGLG